MCAVKARCHEQDCSSMQRGMQRPAQSSSTGQTALVGELSFADALQVNSSPFGDGWIMKVQLSNKGELDDLLDAKAYEKHCEENAH